MADTMKTCAKCVWFYRQKYNTGICTNYEEMHKEGICTAHRFATSTCDGWRKRGNK